MAKKLPEKVVQRSFIREHSFVYRLYQVLVLSSANFCHLAGTSTMRQLLKMQLCYCNSQKKLHKIMLQIKIYNAFQDFQKDFLFQYPKISYNIKMNFGKLSDILRVVF